jgi:glycosyltransferase involved in cell wall biosynthesis
MSPPSVSVIIPARNEEQTIARAVDSLASQPEVSEIIVVNDQSSDGTAAALSALAARIPKLKTLETRELPGGWTGKNYAAWLGASAAMGAWLLFTDADTVHLPGSGARALADAVEHSAAMVSYSPEQEIRALGERALMPFIYSRLAEKFSYARVSNAHFPDAAANGQFLLVQRDAYDAIGGHRAVAGEVLEDVALARRLKQAGYRLYFAPGQGIARTRMYRSFDAMWEGWTKNLYPLIGGSGSAVARELLVVVPWLPLALILFGALDTRSLLGRVLLILGFVLLAGRHAAYAAELRRSHYPASLIVYYVPAVVLYAAALLVSAWKNTRGSVLWKGREYTAGMR